MFNAAWDHTLRLIFWVLVRQVMLSCSPPETFWCEIVHSNSSTSMVSPPSPSSFSPLRHSRALHCRGWLTHPHPHQPPPRAPMPQTATTLLPLRRLLSLFPPPLPPSMPPPPPLALVTRSANWTLWTEWGGACLSGNFCLSSFFLISFAFSSQPMHRICPAWPLVLSSTIHYCSSLFSLFPVIPSLKCDIFERPLWIQATPVCHADGLKGKSSK